MGEQQLKHRCVCFSENVKKDIEKLKINNPNEEYPKYTTSTLNN